MRKLSLLAAVLVLSACDRSTAPLLSSPVGSYQLTTIDRQSLPALASGGDTVLTGGAVLYSNGAYAISWLEPSYYFGVRETIAVVDSGTWAPTGAQLQFVSRSGGTWTGDFSVRTLSVQLDSSAWSFTKR
jgi:hypothetical protein